MSKPNTDQPTPLVVAGEATEVAAETVVKKQRIRTAGKKTLTWVKEHKKTTIAVVGLGSLIVVSSLAGRTNDPSSDENSSAPDVTPDVEDSAPVEPDTTVA